MPIKCPKQLFKFFEASEGWARPDEKGQKFLYEALFEGFQFSDLVCIYIPDLDNKTFNNWEKFENWCSEITGLQMWDIVDEKIQNAEFNENNNTPKSFFKSKKKAKEAIIKSIRTSDSDQIESVTYVEIECEDKKLLLLYSDSDSWTLGWGDSVTVINSLDELTEENGYYTRL
jgi:hypothetical protein